MLTHRAPYLLNGKIYKLGIRMEDNDLHQPQAPQGRKVTRDKSDPSRPNAVPVSLEAGGGIP